MRASTGILFLTAALAGFGQTQTATIAGAITNSEDGGNIAGAKEIGKLVADRAKEKGIHTVVFDRGGYHYHGRVKALAEAARQAGLEF